MRGGCEGARGAQKRRKRKRERWILSAEAGPTTIQAARRTHACDHYGAATEEPWWAVTSTCARRPLRAGEPAAHNCSHDRGRKTARSLTK
jgi:hypothetical protein